MKFWFILAVIYGSGPFEGEVSAIPFATEEQCADAIEPIYDLLYEDNPDVVVQCVPTNMLSGSIRPMPRPETW